MANPTMAKKTNFLIAFMSIIGCGVATGANASSVLVGDFNANRVIKINDETGQFEGTVAQGGGLSRPLGIAYGPDNLLYVASYGTGQIKRYNSAGNFVDDFLTTPKPHGIAFFGNDLVVSNHNVGTIRRSGLLNWISVPKARLYHSVVVRDNRLFCSFSTSAGGGIEEFHPNTGVSIRDFVPISRGLRDVQGFAWGADNKLYATSSANSRLFRFHGETGAPEGFMATSAGEPMGIRFSGSGDVIATSWNQSSVVKYSPSTARLISSLIPSNTSMQQPWYLERVNPTIEARVIFNDWIGATRPATTITATFRKIDTGEFIMSRTGTVQPSGRFDVSSPQFLGQYRISIQVGKFLSNEEFVDTRDASRSVPIFSLVNGDVDSSNVIDADDYQILSNSFNLGMNNVGFDARADLDGDNFVGLDDFNILSRNWALTGEV